MTHRSVTTPASSGPPKVPVQRAPLVRPHYSHLFVFFPMRVAILAGKSKYRHPCLWALIFTPRGCQAFRFRFIDGQFSLEPFAIVFEPFSPTLCPIPLCYLCRPYPSPFGPIFLYHDLYPPLYFPHLSTSHSGGLCFSVTQARVRARGCVDSMESGLCHSFPLGSPQTATSWRCRRGRRRTRSSCGTRRPEPRPCPSTARPTASGARPHHPPAPHASPPPSPPNNPTSLSRVRIRVGVERPDASDPRPPLSRTLLPPTPILLAQGQV